MDVQGFRTLHVKDRVVVLQDSEGHLHFYYDDVYRMVIALGFWREAELEFRDAGDMLHISSAGQDIIRVPLPFDVALPEIEFIPIKNRGIVH